MFGDFGEFDLVGGEFGGGMEDIEVARDARTDMLDMETTDHTGMQVCVCVCVCVCEQVNMVSAHQLGVCYVDTI